MSAEPVPGAEAARRGLKKPRPFSIEHILSSPSEKSPQPALRACRSSQEKAELQGLQQQLQRRTRRHRTIFSEEQLQALETLFHQNQYPDVVTREHLANRIHLKEERVEVWFKNRRAKWRHQKRATASVVTLQAKQPPKEGC
ncbi:hypothetical protein EK904_006244 [Melospiza melodia maxima]|nr:hypothetical protein EK904_006244 [Melospiza melodia maxima]